MIKEVIEKLENIIEKSNNKELKEDIEEIIYNLEQPITLADFLGWDEEQEYEYNDKIIKIINNKLYSKSRNESKFYETLLPLNCFESLKKASKLDLQKYYLKFKEPTLFRFALKEDFTYLNYDKEMEVYFLNTNKELNEYKTRFTKKEIENIKLPYIFDMNDFEMIDVALYDLIEEPEEEREEELEM